MRTCVVLLVGLTCLAAASGQVPSVSESELPPDSRLGPLKTLNGHFPFAVPSNPAAWEVRREALLRRVLVSCGLWPLPEKTPLEPVIFGKVERPGFTVERVYFQSLPGHYVTGLLFRPDESGPSPRPGILSPHGHGGRLQRHSDAEIARQISVGGEHFEKSGRMPKLARCAQLARMGCVSFIFDMLGYADSIQISRQVAHRHAERRPEENNDRGADWVMFSIDADLRLQSIMGLQTWNSIRALDFLASLPDVDPERLAVTGGSGGGTQSIVLGAIDDRIKVSFPNGMVSTSMQGGCYCENCNLLRVGTGNVELAALFAPRPQAMTAADDWTREMMQDGYPELQLLYAMVGNESDVYCRPMLNFKHNYNYVTRATMYQWMNRHLQLGLDDPVVESDFEPLSDSETKVWGADHPAPSLVGVPHERAVCSWFDQQARAQLDKLVPRDADSLAAFWKTMAGAWQVLFDLPLPEAAAVEYESKQLRSSDGFSVERGVLGDKGRGTALPLLTIRPTGSQKRAEGVCVIWSDPEGKGSAFDASGQPKARLSALIRKGATVLLPDLLGQGEFNADGGGVESQRLVDDKRSYSAFTFAYNRTLAAERCGDLLTVIAHATKQHEQVCLLSTGGAALWTVPAAAVAGETVSRCLVEDRGVRFADVDSFRHANFVPGAVKYGDLPVLMALRAPHPLMIVGDRKLPEVVRRTFEAAKAEDALRFELSDITGEQLSWLFQ